METLIQINNAIGPGFRLAGLTLWALAITGLSGAWFYYQAKEAVIIIGHLSLLVVVSWVPEIWLNPFKLMIAHLLIYTLTTGFSIFGGFLRSPFGDWFLRLAGLMAYIDAFAYLYQPPVQIHLWTINILFLLMCSISFVVGIKTHDNAGTLGRNENANSQ
mgnify:CR=1 FL=1